MRGPTLKPGDGMGAPVATANVAHQPRVPMAGGVPPWCSCGWKSARFPRPGERLADHLKQHDPSYGSTHYSKTTEEG